MSTWCDDVALQVSEFHKVVQHDVDSSVCGHSGETEDDDPLLPRGLTGGLEIRGRCMSADHCWLVHPGSRGVRVVR